MRSMVVLWVAAAACSTPATEPKHALPARVIATVDPPQPTLRLPRHFAPTGYRARLAVDPAKPTFTGEIEIAGTLATATHVIWLHGKDLVVRDAKAIGATAIPLTVTPRGEDWLEVRAAVPLVPGTWTLALRYEGKVTMDAVAGAFHSVYGKDAYILTHNEPVYARRIFPCLDEPDRKVPWQLTLDVPAQLVAVANTPIAKTTPLAAGHVRVEFERTRPLPTYLLAFAVGPFAIVDGGASKSGIPVRIVVPRGTEARAAYAAASTAKLIDVIETWFAMKFPYPKLDVIVAPAFDGDAMENAGAIICDPANALVDAKQPSWQSRYTAAIVIGHELAHQWFGDLVTPAWWDDLWLNESFATWMESHLGEWFEPSWQDRGLFVSVRNAALHSDALVSARTIREPIDNPGAILNAFDGITYAKGASVLRMIERYIGEVAFQRGVQAYMHAHVDGVATATDLIHALETASGKPLAGIFASFLDQAGAPVMTAKLACDGTSRVTFTQARFLPPGSNVLGGVAPRWTLPACVAYERDGKRATACGVLDANHASIELAGKCPTWVMPNADGDGYYYNELAVRDVEVLRDRAWPVLTVHERRTLLEDARAQALVGKLPIATLMSLQQKLLGAMDKSGERRTRSSAEGDAESMDKSGERRTRSSAEGDAESMDNKFAIADALGGTGRFLSLFLMTGLPFRVDAAIPAALRDRVTRRVRDSIGPRVRAIGLLGPRASISHEMIAGALVYSAGFVREPALVAQAVKLAANYHELPSEIRGLVLQLAADASPQVADRLHADALAEPERERRNEILNALAHIRDPARLAKHLDLALDPRLDVGDLGSLLFGFDDEATRAGVEQWMYVHLPALTKRLPPATEGSIARFLGVIFTAACDPLRRDAIADFVTKNFAGVLGGARMVKQQIEGMDQCIAQRSLVEPSLRAWLGVK
ncbi:MAG: M1 family metallopeptidase [Kofleriaceae bacterium]